MYPPPPSPRISEHKLDLANMDKNLLCSSPENKTREIVIC